MATDDDSGDTPEYSLEVTDGGFYGTLRVTIPQGAAALADDDQSLNQAAAFEILVDTVFHHAFLASLSLSDPRTN